MNWKTVGRLLIAWAFFIGLVGVPAVGSVLGIGAALILMIAGTIICVVAG